MSETKSTGAIPTGALAVIALLATAVGFGAVYFTGRQADNTVPVPAGTRSAAPAADPGPPSASSASAINPLSTGAMAPFVFKKAPEALPAVTFLDATGKSRSLADFKGKTVLLNLWATWCVPCRKEMPALDRLQKALGGDTFEVVALSVDKGGVEATKKFLGEVKAESLALYADPTLRTVSALKAVGMPTTLLIDRQGREVGRLIGPAEWDGEDAKKLIAATLQPSPR
jgi:thiol-disulfide isomerase/thioredoxin